MSAECATNAAVTLAAAGHAGAGLGGARSMTLGYIDTPERGETDRILTRVATQLAARGARLAGVVQSNTQCGDSALCDMDVQVLPGGPLIRISQSLGAGSRGCRLDPMALEQAVGLVAESLAGKGEAKPELLIVNKFGKHEAEGRGFRPLIGEAMMAGIPVLTSVNRGNSAAFLEFVGEFATHLPNDVAALVDWALAQGRLADRAAS
jgi:hypothetical protein